MATENWTFVTVTGSYVRLDGTPMTGRVIFFPKASLYVDQTSLTTVVGRAIIAPLVGGEFTVQLPATNDPDIVPQNFTYRVQEMFSGGREFNISVPISAAAGGLDLSEVAPVDPSSGEVEVTTVPHQHPISDIPTLQTQLDAKVSTTDPRLSDERTPADHTHPITELTATGTRDNTTYLRGDGTWAVPSGSSQPSGATLEVDDPALEGIVLRAGYELPDPATADNTIYFLLPSPE